MDFGAVVSVLSQPLKRKNPKRIKSKFFIFQ
jgi:hypothetical protein